MNFYSYLKNYKIQNALAKVIIKLYQATLSYFVGGHCRHFPTCSHYAVAAYENFDFSQATKLVFLRVISCHPFSRKSFFDPIPFSNQKRAQS